MRRAMVALLLTFAGQAAHAADPPAVDIHFVIEAKQFVDGLQKNRRSVETAITQQLVEECSSQKSFPFLKWAAGDSSAANHLEVALVERPAGGDYESYLEFRGATKEGKMPPALQQVVYRWFQPKNADSPLTVKNHLRDLVRKLFAKEQFRDSLLHYFVSRVPLAQNVNIDVQGRAVVVPFPGATLQADEKRSEFAVSWLGKTDNRPGAMTLNELHDYADRGVLCAVKEFDFAGAPRSGWSERIPQVFTPQRVHDVRVTISSYVPKWFAGVHDGSLTDD